MNLGAPLKVEPKLSDPCEQLELDYEDAKKRTDVTARDWRFIAMQDLDARANLAILAEEGKTMEEQQGSEGQEGGR